MTASLFLAAALLLAAPASAAPIPEFECDDSDPLVVCGWLLGHPNVPDGDYPKFTIPSSNNGVWHTIGKVHDVDESISVECDPEAIGVSIQMSSAGVVKMRAQPWATTGDEVCSILDGETVTNLVSVAAIAA